MKLQLTPMFFTLILMAIQALADPHPFICKKRQSSLSISSSKYAQTVIGHGPRGPLSASWEIGIKITLNDVSLCPVDLPLNESKEKCNTGKMLTSWNTVVLKEPLRYERDSTNRFFRTKRLRDIINEENLETVGPWIEAGCSLLPTRWTNHSATPPPYTLVAMICHDCTPTRHGEYQELFACEC
ncbi:unnamed protein product [Rotaria sordida]|uniref:Uncharacterized protein n=1 Tax=Rotaria sordida TaxID=392033 RepID=A0A815JM28_9BILA|nr:unnamed protein product [Rotaria sordida]CAF1384070.1 unnamed protein product [Rotaria sordida]